MAHRRFLICFGILALVLPGFRESLGQFDELVTHIPESANVLVIADAARILDSPIARQQDWKSSHQQLFSYGQTSIPPNTELMIVAADLDYEFVQPRWLVAMLQVTGAPSLNEIARQQRGTLSSVGGYPAVELPNDSYLVDFGNNLYGSVAPASRQSASRWARKRGARLSPYLSRAYDYVAVRQYVDAALAIDLQDAVSQEEVLEQLKTSDSAYLRKANLNAEQLKQLSEVLASIRGVMLGVRFSNTQQGTILVDFGKDISSLRPFAQEMLLKVLKEYGAFIPDFEDWTVQLDTEHHEVLLKGELSMAGRRRIMSLIEIPATPTAAAEQQTAGNGGDAEEYASKAYFSAIQNLLDELGVKNPEAKTLGQVAMWMDKYAQKIDRLPLRDVYPEVRDYGRFVATNLRDAGMAYKGIGIHSRVAALEAGSQAGPSYYYGGYRYGRYGAYGAYGYSWDAFGEQRARTEARARVKARGAKSANEIMTGIRNAEGDLRREVAEKYNIDL